MSDLRQRTLMTEDLDEARCHVCGEIESKSSMEWLINALGEQGWVCQECLTTEEEREWKD